MSYEQERAQQIVTATKARQLKAKFPDLTVEIVGSWIWITGDTFPHRADLRAAGLFFQRAKDAWFWKPGSDKPARGKKTMSWEHIRTKYGSAKVRRTEDETAA